MKTGTGLRHWDLLEFQSHAEGRPQLLFVVLQSVKERNTQSPDPL